MEQERFIVEARIYSQNGEIQDVVVVGHKNNNNYIIITKAGVKCKAMKHPLTGLFYADDKYGIC